MSLPEGYLPRKGDELLIRSRVTYNCEKDDADVHVEMIGAEHRKYMVSLDKVHSLHCRAWNEGNKVTSDEFDGPGIIICTHGKYVWLKVLTKVITGDQESFMFTIEANELEPYLEPVPFDTMDTIDPTYAESFDHPVKPLSGSQSAIGDDEEIKF